MVTTDAKAPSDYIVPLYMNGLQGRMLYLPAPPKKKREILFIYGHHSTIERWWGIAQVFNKYGALTMPDLPGFGGMQSFFKIGEKPTLDAMADYLAAFVKMRYARKKVTIVGMSYGFLVVTRMLQRYPDLTKKVDLLFSLAGFSHKDDFKFSKRRHFIYRVVSRVLGRLPFSLFFKNVVLYPPLIRAAYGKTPNAKHKFSNLDPQARKFMMDFEVELWHANDVRTHWRTTVDMLSVDNCQKQIHLPVNHVAVSGDQYFDNHRVEQHMRIVYADFKQATAQLKSHAPSIIADASEAAPLLPTAFKRMLARQPK